MANESDDRGPVSDVGTGDLPAGWGWESDIDGRARLAGPIDGSRIAVATAFPGGGWRAGVSSRHNVATPRPGESLLAAAQRCAVAALWRRDGFGVGEVRGLPVPLTVADAIALTAETALPADVAHCERPTPLPGLAGLWRLHALRVVGDGVEVDARRVDAVARYEREHDPQGTCLIRGCSRDASGAHDSNGDLCGEHRTAENALGREPIATPESEPHPLALRCQGCGDAIPDGAPFSERVSDGCPFCLGCAAENAAGDDPDEMRPGELHESEGTGASVEPHLHDEIRARSFLPAVPCKTCGANVARWVVREMNVAACNGCGATHVEGPAPAVVAELARLLPGLAEKARLVRQMHALDLIGSDTSERDCAVACELLLTEREQLIAMRDGAYEGGAALRARVTELEAERAKSPDFATDAMDLTLAAEQSIRYWLRAHGHDPDARPWDETVIALLDAAPAGWRVAGLLARVEEAGRGAAENVDDDATYHAAGAVSAYKDARRLIRDAFPAPSSLDGVVAEVLALNQRPHPDSEATPDDYLDHVGTLAEDGLPLDEPWEDVETVRDRLKWGAAMCLAGLLACDKDGGSHV